MNLLDSNGPLDKVNATFGLVYTTALVLGVAFAIPPAEDFLRLLNSVFGLFDTGGTIYYDKGHSANAAFAFAVPVYGMYLPMILGTEGSVHRHSRHVFGFWVWLGWLLFNLKFLKLDTEDPFSGSPANYFWIANNGFMAYLHYTWVGNDIRGKFKKFL